MAVRMVPLVEMHGARPSRKTLADARFVPEDGDASPVRRDDFGALA